MLDLDRLMDRVLTGFGQGKEVRAAIAAARPVYPWRFAEHPDVTTSLSILRQIELHNCLNMAPFLHGLLVPSEPCYADVDIRDVTGVTATDGHYYGNLDRLRLTVDNPEKFMAQPSEAEREWLVNQVLDRAGGIEPGLLPLIQEGWSGRLIMSNSGCARRFAWLRHYGLSRKLPARIQRYDLNPAVLKVLAEDYWICLVQNDVSACVINRFQFHGPAGRDTWPKQAFEIHIDPCPPATHAVGWSGIVCERDHPFYRVQRAALEDAPFEVFDFSRWLHLLAQGRQHP